jgi:hypothetical protein
MINMNYLRVIDLICGTNYSNSSGRGFIMNLTTARWWGRNPNLGLEKYFIGTLSLAPLFNPTSEDSSISGYMNDRHGPFNTINWYSLKLNLRFPR